ncbi:MAG: hypothetical protein NC085_11985, partial [Muribaculaceae bacterium]|nr:hypothetical protein [Muribaculaceae bacterium]
MLINVLSAFVGFPLLPIWASLRQSLQRKCGFISAQTRQYYAYFGSCSRFEQNVISKIYDAAYRQNDTSFGRSYKNYFGK